MKMMKWSSQWTQFMQLRKEAWKKFRTSTGFEPVTSRLPVRCSTNWAKRPLTLGAGPSFFQASLRNCINCVHCDDHFFIFISFPQFIYDLFHISLTKSKLFHNWISCCCCWRSYRKIEDCEQSKESGWKTNCATITSFPWSLFISTRALDQSAREKSFSYCKIFIVVYRILSTYIIWRAIKDQVPLLSRPFRAVHDEFRKRLLGSKSNKTREATCFSYTNNVLGPMLGAVFIRNAFSPESKQKVYERVPLRVLQSRNPDPNFRAIP